MATRPSINLFSTPSQSGLRPQSTAAIFGASRGDATPKPKIPLPQISNTPAKVAETPPPSLRGTLSSAPIFGDTSFTVLVGPEDNTTPFSLHKSLAVNESAFFESALRNEWKESNENIVRLPEHAAEHFQIFFLWLYTQRIFSSQVTAVMIGDAVIDGISNEEWGRLAGAWALGAYLQATDFQDAVADTILDNASKSWATFSDIHKIIYPNSSVGSPIRKLLVDIAVSKWSVPFLESQSNDNAWSDFFCDLSIALLKTRESAAHSRVVRFSCDYHEHTQKVTGGGISVTSWNETEGRPGLLFATICYNNCQQCYQRPDWSAEQDIPSKTLLLPQGAAAWLPLQVCSAAINHKPAQLLPNQRPRLQSQDITENIVRDIPTDHTRLRRQTTEFILLNRTPAETCNEIYKLAFSPSVPGERVESHCGILGSKQDYRSQHTLALLATCKQIRNEAFDIALSHVTWVSKLDLSRCRTAGPLLLLYHLRCLSEQQRASLSSIKLVATNLKAASLYALTCIAELFTEKIYLYRDHWVKKQAEWLAEEQKSKDAQGKMEEGDADDNDKEEPTVPDLGLETIFDVHGYRHHKYTATDFSQVLKGVQLIGKKMARNRISHTKTIAEDVFRFVVDRCGWTARDPMAWRGGTE